MRGRTVAIRHYGLTRERLRKMVSMVGGALDSTRTAPAAPPVAEDDISAIVMEIIRAKSGPRGVAVQDVIDDGEAGGFTKACGACRDRDPGDKRRLLPAPERIRKTIMKLEFIRDGPALVIENTERLLIVADLHFGIEADLAAHGMHFRSHSTERLDRLMKTIDATNPDRLILLGDVKHSIPSLTRQEWSRDPGCPRYDPAPHPDPCLPGKPRHRYRTVP